MTYRSTSHTEVQGLVVRSNATIQEIRHHLDTQYAHCRHNSTRIPLSNLPEEFPSTIEQGKQPHLQTAALPAKLAKRLQTIILPVLISARSFKSMNMMDITLSVRRGRVIFERWTTSGQAVFEVSSSEPSYGMEISMQTSWILPIRISLIILLTTRLLARWSLSASIQMKHHRVVPMNSEIAEAVRTGNMTCITKLFNDGRARPTDVLLNGYTLIHVG